MVRHHLILCFVLGYLCCDIVTSEEVNDDGVEVESIPYESPPVRKEGVYFSEHFDDPKQFEKKWIKSQSKKPDVSEDIAKYDGGWDLLPLDRFPLKNDKGLVLMSESRHSAIAAKFFKPFKFDADKPLIVQYVVTFQNNHDCGGAYIKLLTEGALTDLKDFNDKTPYTIMFGPDKCGNNAKIHFIIRHKNPVNGTITEKHCTKLKGDDAMYTTREPFLLKLLIKPDNAFQFFINNNLQYEGNLLSKEVFEPPINPDKEIVDPTDKKPADWDERVKIPDPDAVKPADWDEDEPQEIVDEDAVKPADWLEDESPMIPDEKAIKPDDWDEEMDGEWEPPSISNPKCEAVSGCGPWTAPTKPNPRYKGKWYAPMIDNPNYTGKWIAKKIPNPDYYYDDAPLKASPIDAIGFELWSLVNNIYFDDILITDNEDYSEEWAERTWVLKKRNIASESTSWYKSFLQYTNEYPWLWAVYVFVLAIIVGLIGICFFRSKPNVADYDRATLHKKTDEHGEPSDLTEENEQTTQQDATESEQNAAQNLEDDELLTENELIRDLSNEKSSASDAEATESDASNSNDAVQKTSGEN